MSGDHAKLAPSSAHRWLECHGSVELCARAPDRETSYAFEGTVAHDIAAKCREANKDAASYLNTVHRSESGLEVTVNDEMVRHVNDYLDFIDSLQLMWGGEPKIETRVKVSEHIWGTADMILLSGDGETLHVLDLKYGAGKVVEVEGNYQAICYAIGALRGLGAATAAKVKQVIIHIYQPRAGGEPWREWEISLAGIESAEIKLLEAQGLIMAGSQKLKAGSHCQFCDAAPTCPERAKEANIAARDVFSNNSPPPIETLSTEKLVAIHALAPRVVDWLKQVHDFIVRKLERGEPVPGYKLIEKIGNRRWVDKEVAEQMLGLYGVNPHNAPSLVTPAEAERRLAGAGIKLSIDSLVERPVTGQALVPDSNPNAPASPKATFNPIAD